MTDLPVAGEAGVVPYVFVERVDETLEMAVAQGGEIVTPPYPEGDLRVATFRDPAGNVIGVWQQGSAARAAAWSRCCQQMRQQARARNASWMSSRRSVRIRRRRRLWSQAKVRSMTQRW